MRTFDRFFAVVTVLALVVTAFLYATNTDGDARRRCQLYLRQSHTAAESLATLVERPTRMIWRDAAPTCRAVLATP